MDTGRQYPWDLYREARCPFLLSAVQTRLDLLDRTQNGHQVLHGHAVLDHVCRAQDVAAVGLARGIVVQDLLPELLRRHGLPALDVDAGGKGQPVAVLGVRGGKVVARLGLERVQDVQPGLDIIGKKGHLVAAGVSMKATPSSCATAMKRLRWG